MAYTPKTWETGEIIEAEELNHIEQGIAAADQSAAEAQETADEAKAIVVGEFLTTKTYTTGEYCIYSGALYRFKEDKTAGEWDSTKVVAVALADDVADLKSAIDYSNTALDYVVPIVAPAMMKTSLGNGTISNPNNSIAVRTVDMIPCKYGDTVTMHPARPNTTGYYYSYGYRVYDANGNTVANFPDVSPSYGTVKIAQSNAASIKYFWIETDGTNNISLRSDSYGYIPYAIVQTGESIIERVENLYLTYGALSGKYTITHDSTAYGTLTYGDAHFMAIIPCAPNLRYHIKLTSAVTTHPRLWLAWSEEYPARGGMVYDIEEKDNATLEAYYTTGKTARFLFVYLGFTMASGDPTSKITITGDTYYQDPYARQYINDTHDLYQQAANVLRLKKTGDETYDECDAKFMFMTDIHADEARLADSVKRFKSWGDEYISAVLNGGDTVYQKLPDGLEWYYEQIDTLNIPVLPTVGNHDAWSALSVLEADPTVVYNAIIAPIASTSGIVQPASAAANGYNYYYKDFNSTVRLVVLDCMYWDATQLSWFESVLADAKTNGLHVIALTHSSFPWADMTTVDCSWSKAGMVNGYSSKAILSDPSRTNIQAAQAVKNFVDAGGTFICWLTGHQHGDDVHILQNYGNQFVVTMGSFAQRASTLQKSDVVSDYNYNCLTYIAIDTFMKVVKFMRVGADIDAYGTKHNFMSIKYDEQKIISAT